MFDKPSNAPENDPLKGKFDGIDQALRASAELKKAAKTGIPLYRSKRESTAVHLRRFAKATVAYAVGVLLFLGAVMMLPKLWNTNEPVNHPANSPNSSAQCNHKYVALTIGLPDSCTEGRVHAYQCQYCGDSYSEQDPPLGHNYVDGICTRCGAPENTEAVPMLSQFGDPEVINSALVRMGLQFDYFANESISSVKEFLDTPELNGFLTTYYYTCEKLSSWELFYTFGKKCKLTTADVANLKLNDITQEQLAYDCYCFTGAEAKALLTRYAAVPPTWIDQLQAILIAEGYYYHVASGTFYNFVMDSSLVLNGIHVTEHAMAKSGERIVFYSTMEGEKRMVVLKSDGDSYRFVGNCPTDYLYNDGSEILPPDSDCIHDLNPVDCPYCACDGHSWSDSDSTATCTKDGIRERTCQKCGYVEIIEVKAYGHDYHFGICSRCDDILPPLEITIPIPDPGKMSAALEAEIKEAYAKQYDEDPTDLSIEFVADLGDGAYAIFVDGPWQYPCMEEEHIVHGYLFWYSSGRTMDIYKDGAVYGLSKAYDQGVIDANQVLDLYLIYADRMGYLGVRNPEKYYTWATIEDNFDADEIIIVTFPEYNFYPYTAEDFAEIGCIELRNLWFDEDDPSKARIILLKLDKNSKQNVLNCIKILEHRADLESAEPSFNIELHD